MKGSSDMLLNERKKKEKVVKVDNLERKKCLEQQKRARCNGMGTCANVVRPEMPLLEDTRGTSPNKMTDER